MRSQWMSDDSPAIFDRIWALTHQLGLGLQLFGKLCGTLRLLNRSQIFEQAQVDRDLSNSELERLLTHVSYTDIQDSFLREGYQT